MFGSPLLLLLGPVAVVLLWLFERWRQQPLEVVVADLALFQPSPAAEQEAKARQRRVQLSWLLRVVAALLLSLAAAQPRLPAGPGGPVTVDLVLDRGLSSGTRDGERTRLDRSRAELSRVLDRLRDDDAVRLHLVPGPPPRAGSVAAARRALAEARPTGARARVARALEPLAGGAVASNGPPVFVATSHLLGLPAPLRAGVELASAGSPQPDRAILALARVASDLHVTVGAQGEAAEVQVELAARDAAGTIRRATRTLSLPVDGVAIATWTAADGFPSGAREASARLVGSDALPTNDRAFAALAPIRPRVVGVVEDADPPVLRALRAVPGTEVRRLATPPNRKAAAAFDLLVVPRLPRRLPPTALIAIPLELPDAQVAGGRVGGNAHPAFPHTLRALSGEPEAVVPKLGPLASDLREAVPLLRAGAEPFVVLRGQGRRLVAAVRAPLRGEATPWVQLRSFPIFWGELLELAAPRAAGGLAAHVAGRPWLGDGLEGPPLEVRRYVGADGRLLLGTVAAPLDPTPLAPAQAFGDGALARIDAARPVTARPSLTPLLAILALLFACASWAPLGSGSGNREPLPAKRASPVA